MNRLLRKRYGIVQAAVSQFFNATRRGQVLGWVSLLSGAGILLGGHSHFDGRNLWCLVKESYEELAFTLFAIAGTVLIIDRLNQAKAREATTTSLIRDLLSNNNPLALRSARELAALGALQDGTLSDRDLSGADLEGAQLGGLVAKNGRLSSCQLSGADLSRCNLRNANLNLAVLQGTILEGSDLRGASLIEATLVGADLAGSDLREANLSSSRCGRADFRDADLRGCNLCGAHLSEAKLAGAQVGNAVIDDSTVIEEPIANLEDIGEGRKKWPPNAVL